MKVGVPGIHLPCHLSLPLKTCFTLPPYHLGDLTTGCFSLQHPPTSVCKVLRKGSPLLVTGFPCGWAGKESACNAGDLSSISGLGRSPGEGKGSPLQYSGLENSMDCIVHGVAKSQTRLRDFHFHLLVTGQVTYSSSASCSGQEVGLLIGSPSGTRERVGNSDSPKVGRRCY